jgi:hypothetical protein
VRRTIAGLRLLDSLPDAGREALAEVWEHVDRARTARSQDRYADAEAADRRVLEIPRQWLGEDHREVADSYPMLASDLTHLRDYPAPESMEKKALAICQTVLGDNHPDTARSYRSLANRRSVQRKDAAADAGRGAGDRGPPDWSGHLLSSCQSSFGMRASRNLPSRPVRGSHRPPE